MIKIGVDVHIYIVKDKKIIGENLYDGRNSEWFRNLEYGEDFEYEKFQWYKEYDFSNQCPDNFIEKYKNEYGYYGFFYISVKDFKDWYNTTKPWKKAGWVSTYDAWAIKNKGYVPDYLPRYKSEDEDQFIEYIDEYEPSSCIYDYLIDKKNNIPDDADIQIFFDC